MTRTNVSNYNFYSVCLILFFLFISHLACKKEVAIEGDHLTKTESDSILTWIEFGRDTNNSTNGRKEYLVKAYQSAKSEKRDTTKLRYFSKIQYSFFGLQDSLWFRKTNREAIKLAHDLKDSVRLGGFYWDLGEFLNRNGVKDSSYFNLSEAQKVYEALGNDLNAGKLEYDMARIQTDVKNYTSAEVNAIEAIELLKPLEDNVMLYNCYNLLGIISKDLGDYQKSLEYYALANSYLNNPYLRGMFSSQLDFNIGVTYQEMGNHKKGKSYFVKVLNQDSLRFKNPAYYARALNNLACSTYEIDSTINVEEMFMVSIGIRDSIKDMADLAGGNYEFSEYYLRKKDTAHALERAKKAAYYAEKSDNNERLLESLALLTQLDQQNASVYGQRYMALNDSLQLEERKIRNKFARIRFETDEVVAENELLARQKQLWAGIAFSILLLGTASYVIVDQRAKNQKLRFQQEQQASNEKIFNLMLSEKQKFEEGKKIEQKRISEELHDGILGKMLGARMVLTGLNKKSGDAAISERANAIVALKNVEGEVRTISHELSHAAYQEIHNFIRSMRDLLKNNTGAVNINYTFNYDEMVEWDDLRGDIKINLYRIVQESLQNAIKHSHCQSIDLDFSIENDKLEVLIKDDGVGFVLNKKKRKGIGMRNLQSRIDKLDGKWQIDSKPGEGTSVKLSIPIKYFSKEPQIFNESKEVEKV